MKKEKATGLSITALKVQQWLPDWDTVAFKSTEGQGKPKDSYFLLCSVKAGHLKALTGVYRRTTKGGTPRVKDPNVQRGHEERRSTTIRKFVQFGFPWCEMDPAKRNLEKLSDLQKPGWLPTAVIVNILPPSSERNGIKIAPNDIIRVEDRGDTVLLRLPKEFRGPNWEPAEVYPLEVIDGQHRLWAFEDFAEGADFELPVVAFYGLDRGWQAYLFWSVNITPKRINRSLAFDLYPLLRQQTWLDKFEGHSIYRETRCQELVEALWSHPSSPWQHRINMLGESRDQREYKGAAVTQAAWIRSLMASFVKSWEGSGTRVGGLFGPPPSKDFPLLPWNRAMQAAVLIFSGEVFKKQVADSNANWAKHLREVGDQNLPESDDPAFFGDYSLISTDQGVRGFLFSINDLCFVESAELELEDWRWEAIVAATPSSPSATDEGLVSAALKSFRKTKAAKFIEAIASGLSTFDWRTSSTRGLTESQRLHQSVYRGSSGYKEMRRALLRHLAGKSGRVASASTSVEQILQYR